MAELKGQTILVLGGTSGIGLATARASALRGARVFAAGRSAQRVQSAQERAPDGLTFEIVDAADEADVETLLGRVGAVDHIFVTAGRTMNDPDLVGDRAEQAETLGARFWSAVNVARASAAHVRSGGSVTFTSGVAAWKPIRGSGLAAASCAAVEALARQLALDMKPTRFNVIAPGLVDTPLLRGFVGPDSAKAYADFSAVIPAGRIGAPEDVAHAAIFLMENEYVNGTALVVDGGYRLT